MKRILSEPFSLLTCHKTEGTRIAAEAAVSIEAAPGECADLTKDTKGNAVRSRVRVVNDSTAAFCYAINSGGKRFWIQSNVN